MKKMTKKLLVISILLSFLFLNTGCTFWYKTSSTEIGVKVNKLNSLFGKPTVNEKIAESSRMHMWIPFVNDFFVFDTSIQSIEMTFDTKSGDIRVRDDILFKTIDGNDISLDVAIQYRIIASKAPYILKHVARNNKELKFKVVRTFCRSIPRDIFGELKTEEFYEQAMRQGKAEIVKTKLNEILEPYGVLIENVLPRDYRFNPAYQQAIEDKKVADQLVEKNRSATKAAKEEYTKKLEEVKGDVNKLVAAVDGEFSMAKLKADAYYDQQKEIASAIEFEGKAEGRAIRQKNQALKAAGGEVLVKLAIAKALQGKKIIIVPTSGGMNLKTMDINELLKVYGVKNLSKKK
jgi:regulator of protease activity HflC (stomatin/prohibitin superfamily)